MLELFGLIATGAVSAWGYVRSKSFVRRRLTYVDALQRPGVPLLAGAAAAALAAPVVWLLPLVGTGSAVVFGVGVGAGVAAGRRGLSRNLPTLRQ